MNIIGETIQNGEPSPEHPVEIENKTNILLAIEILKKLKTARHHIQVDKPDGGEEIFELPYLSSIEQQAIETVLNELKKRDEIIKTLQEIKKEALLDDLGKQYNIYKHVDLSKCLHCGENIPHYCEKCYQQLISDISKYQGG